jgi:hypothetical protein
MNKNRQKSDISKSKNRGNMRGNGRRRAPKRTSFFRAGAEVEADAGEIGRDEGRWICEPSPAPEPLQLLPPPGTGHSCEDLFVEAAKNRSND